VGHVSRDIALFDSKKVEYKMIYLQKNIGALMLV